MVQYNPKDWFGLIFKFHKSDTFRKLFWVMVSLAVYAFLFIYFERKLFGSDPKSTTIVHTLLGFVISLLLVFRTNTAYDRWWEGRKQWGALVNVSRNFAIKVNAFIPNSDENSRKILFDFCANYASVLKEHLRNTPAKTVVDQLPEHLAKVSSGVDHVPNHLSTIAQNTCLMAYRKHEMGESSYLSMINDINAFADICGACERIKNSPIPYNYNIFIKKFIFIYIVSMPLAFVGDFGYWSILVTVFTFYTLASLELIAETIEDPFGIDADDLPTDQLAETIKRNVESLKSVKLEE